MNLELDGYFPAIAPKFNFKVISISFHTQR